MKYDDVTRLHAVLHVSDRTGVALERCRARVQLQVPHTQRSILRARYQRRLAAKQLQARHRLGVP